MRDTTMTARDYDAIIGARFQAQWRCHWNAADFEYQHGRRYARAVFTQGHGKNAATFMRYVNHYETQLWLARLDADTRRGFLSFVHSLQLRERHGYHY